MKNSKILIVGSFPKNNKIIIGGINKSCEILINSKEFSKYEISTIDSSSSSNPPPYFVVRVFSGIKRLFKYSYQIIFNRPNTVIIFCSDGFSAIEKGLMIYLANILSISSMIFPRAGNLIRQVKSSKSFSYLIKFLFNKATVFLSQGENWSNFAKEQLRINPETILEIPNWTATEELIKIGENRQIVKKDKLNLLFVGWLEKEKGVQELLNAVIHIKKRQYKFKMIFIGDGTIMSDVKKFIVRNNLTENIELKGWQNSETVLKFYAISDIFILPSWKEGMPNSLIESISSGLPSIVTKVGVIPNYLKDSYDSIQINPNNESELINAIEKLMNSTELRKKISKNSLMTAKSVFLSNKSLDKLTKAIDKLN